MEKLTLKKSYNIQAPVSAVWNALTDPAIIKQYFFGTDTETDWKKGSPIFFRGTWEGRQYEDKGTILDIEQEKFILYNYWSSFSDKPDKPENYANIRYELTKKNGSTVLTVTQDGLDSQEKLEHSKENWDAVINNMKKLIEN